MAIRLEKGARINLEKSNGSKLTNFFVGCNWGAITKPSLFGFGKKTIDVDLDLSCLMFDKDGKAIDHIYSPLFSFGSRNLGLPNGKLLSNDGALRHTGDDLKGDQDGDDGLDNEIIIVNLDKVNPQVQQIVFFLNIYNNEEYSGDFSGIPYASIRMFEGSYKVLPGDQLDIKVNAEFAKYDVATRRDCVGMRGLVMGKLYRRSDEWKFAAIGEAYPDPTIIHTIRRVMKDYSK